MQRKKAERFLAGAAARADAKTSVVQNANYKKDENKTQKKSKEYDQLLLHTLGCFDQVRAGDLVREIGTICPSIAFKRGVRQARSVSTFKALATGRQFWFDCFSVTFKDNHATHVVNSFQHEFVFHKDQKSRQSQQIQF